MGLRKSIKALLIIKKKVLIYISVLLLIMFLGNLLFKNNTAILITEIILITIFSAWPSYKYITTGGITRKDAFLANVILNLGLSFILYFIQIVSLQDSMDYKSVFIFLTIAFIAMFIGVLFEVQSKERAGLILFLYYIIFMLLYFFPVIIFKSSFSIQCIVEAIFFIISVLSLIWGWKVLKNHDI